MGVFGVVTYGLILAGMFVWHYKVVYNNSIIRNYSIRNKLTKLEINGFISDLNAKYYTNIKSVNIENDERFDTERKETIDVVKASNTVVNVMFSLTLTFAIMLIILIMSELMASLTSDTRVWVFHMIIDSLGILTAYVIPFALITLMINQQLFPSKKNHILMLTTFVVYLIWFIILHKFGDLSESFAHSIAPHGTVYENRSLLDRKINQISVAGITIISILSGIGSTTTIYKQVPEFFTRKSTKREITELDINDLISSYNNTNSLMQKRQEELNQFLIRTGGSVHNNRKPGLLSQLSSDSILLFNGGGSNDSEFSGKNNKLGNIFHKVQSFTSLSSLSMSEESQEQHELNQEISGLFNLKESIYDDLNKSLYKFLNQLNHQQQNQSLTLLLKWSNVLFAVYCIYRIFNVFCIKLPYYYLFKPTHGTILDEEQLDSTKDALAITISKLISSIVNLSGSETQLINQVSFILSGSLFLCSFSNVLMTLKSFGSIIPTISQMSIVVKNWCRHLFISQLLATYVLATCLLMRTNLPLNLSYQISQIFSLSGAISTNKRAITTREIEFIDHWFDLIYAVSCAATFVLIFLKNSITDSPDDLYDEELIIEDTKTNYKVL